MKHRRYLSALAACTALILFWGCEKDDICPEGTAWTPDAQMAFYYYDLSGVPREYPQEGLRFYGLNGTERMEQIDLAQAAKTIALPVDFEAEQTRWLIEKDNPDYDPNAEPSLEPAVLTDTITLRYTPELQFISKACGFRFIFQGVTVECTTNDIILEIGKDIEESPADGVLFNSRQVTAKLYFKTTEE